MADDMTAQDPAATLAGIRTDAENEAAGLGPTRRAAERDIPRLVAALEAVLKLADSARSVCEEYEVDTDSFRATAWTLDPAKLREAVTAALAKEAGDA